MGSKFHVLAVDDSVIDRKLIERPLKASSYQVTVVDSGNKALEYLGLIGEQQDQTYRDQVAVNHVITDYFMPGMTGHELLRKIKESRSCKDMPVVIMSSEDVPSRISRCLKTGGADEFFLKPVRLSDVNKLRPFLLRGRSREKYPGVEEGCRLPSGIPTLAGSKNQTPDPENKFQNCCFDVLRSSSALLPCAPNFSKNSSVCPPSLICIRNFGSDVLHFAMYHPNRNLAVCLCFFYCRKHVSQTIFTLKENIYFSTHFPYHQFSLTLFFIRSSGAISRINGPIISWIGPSIR